MEKPRAVFFEAMCKALPQTPHLLSESVKTGLHRLVASTTLRRKDGKNPCLITNCNSNS